MESRPYFLTFYSYKGGVGRSMALLNCAWQLAAWGRHVLMVDMDLEAPGLSGFLKRSGSLAPLKPRTKRVDLLDLLAEFEKHPAPDPVADQEVLLDRLEKWRGKMPLLERFLRSIDQSEWPEHLTPKAVPTGRIDLLGVDEARDYTERLARCSIRDLSGPPLEKLANTLRWLVAGHTFDTTFPELEEVGLTRQSPYDYVLIDSRTGLTEIGGACLGPLSDGLVILLGLNDQNIEGTRMVLKESGILPIPKKRAKGKRTKSDKKEVEEKALPDPGDFPGSKPAILVASPVPTGEIEYKQRRLKIIEERIGAVQNRLSYHPLLALEETSFVARFPEEYLAIEYQRLCRRLTELAGEEGRRLQMAALMAKEDGSKALESAVRLAGIDPAAAEWLFQHILKRNDYGILSLREIQAAFSAGARFGGDPAEHFNQWGIALLAQAKTKEGPAAERLFKAAGEKYEQALAIKPDKHEALYNWGNALSAQARTKEGAAADRLFKAAGEKYEQALAIKPDDHEALNNWGNALSAQGRTKEGPEPTGFFKAAGEKYEQALAIKPDKHEALSNWGNALSDQAENKEGPAADRLFKAAFDKYEQAFAIKPDDHEALNNWGTALSAQAKTKEGTVADGLFKAAGEKYEQALAIKPDNPDVLYNFACWHALQKQEKDAVKLLKQAIATGEAVTRKTIREDSDFDLVRNQPAFEKFVESLPEG